MNVLHPPVESTYLFIREESDNYFIFNFPMISDLSQYNEKCTQVHSYFKNRLIVEKKLLMTLSFIFDLLIF